MTYEMEYMTRLFACGALGIKAEPPSRPVDWEKVVRLAVEQSVTYTVALALKDPDTGCPEYLRERLSSSQRGAAIKNYLISEGILRLTAALEEKGIPAVVIKGFDAAKNYASPECRLSADSDLLVSPENETAALKVLREHGFSTEKRKKDELHTFCTHPDFGILELHISVLTESHMRELQGSGRLNARAVADSVMTSYNGMPYRALEPTDNMLFLTYHMLKHFTYGGISLRMLMDNVLFAMKNASLIDRARYAGELADARYSRVAQLLFGTAEKYFGISRDVLPIPPITDEQGIESIMDDLETGGWEGCKYKASPSVWAWQYYRRENALKANDRDKIKGMRSDGSLVLRWALFPGRNRMKLAYPILEKHMILYPFCWAHRAVKRGIPWLKSGGLRKVSVPRGDEERLSEEARKRLELYRRLELL